MSTATLRSALGAGIVCLGTMLPAAASAQGYAVMEPVESETRHRVSVTFSPIHLILPIFEVSAELRLRRRLSVSAIFGGGSLKVPTSSGAGNSFGVFEIGAQGRFYFLGDFDHGLHLGVEAIYVGASGSSGGTAILADGFSIGPLLGYKIAARFGLTFEIQGGAQFVAARASGSGGGGSAMASTSAFAPLLNINLGWSF